MNKKIIRFMVSVMASLAFCSCSEQVPDVFQDINGVYFNNRTNTNILQDSTDVTFVYQKGDEMQVAVEIQLVGRPSDQAREIALAVSSEDAQEGIDYVLPTKAEMPAGETAYEYVVTLRRTAALKTQKKHLKFTLQPNANFTLPVTQETTSNGDVVTTLEYGIVFSDQFTTAPKAWEKGLLGDFTQQKFELACSVLDLDPADFNDASKMTLAMQSYISAEMQTYVRQQENLKSLGLDYDKNAFDASGNALLFADE